MILVTQRAFARGDIRNEEKYFNPLPDKAQETEAIFKTYKLFIYEDLGCITN